jgi:hypothetical protein
MSKRLVRRIVLPVSAFYLYLAWAAPFVGQWDSFDYLKQIVTRQFSALGIGRPVFIGYNILLWESMKRAFGLHPERVEVVVLAGTVLIGVLGVVFFHRLASALLQAPASRMAALAFAVSPVYALYSGFVMTEVPMLAALLASAVVLMETADRRRAWADLSAGILFGLAVGIREQALTLGPAMLWVLYRSRRDAVSQRKSMAVFIVSAGITTLAPALIFYLGDPAGFPEKVRAWFHAVPAGPVQFRTNFQASLLYALAVCTGAWLAAAGAGIYRLWRGRGPQAGADQKHGTHVRRGGNVAEAVLGVLGCLILPLAFLWFDADVQMHPRYLLAALPASVILCARLFSRWAPSRRSPAVWAVVQVLVLGAAMAALGPYRQAQDRRMAFAREVRDAIAGEALMISGNCSPILDYYRAIGVRPEWRILWSGWDWDMRTVEAEICRAWREGTPVYLSWNPSSWSHFEKEFLDLHFLLKDCAREQVAPMLFRVFPPRRGPLGAFFRYPARTDRPTHPQGETSGASRFGYYGKKRSGWASFCGR